MRKIFLFFAAASLASVVFSGCGKDNIDDESLEVITYAGDNDKITITAAIVSDGLTPETRVGLEDEGVQGIKLTWAEGDGITMYDSNGDFAATFALDAESAGLQSGTFTLINGDITGGAQYTAVYPADEALTLDERNRSVDTATQSGSGAMEHLSDICYMMADYIYSAENIVSFGLEYAMMTIIIASPVEGLVGDYGAPQSLTITNGVNQNTVRINGVTDLLSPFTVYMLVEPTADAGRTLTFDLVSGNNNGSYTFSKSIVNVDTEYEAGKRYTAQLSGENVLSLGDGWRLVDFSATNYPTGDTWIVADAIRISDPVPYMHGLKDALNAAYEADDNARINLTMPNAIGIPSIFSMTDTENSDMPFLLCDALVSINLPVVTEIGSGAFVRCSNLATIDMPNVEILQFGAFALCGIETVSLPAATEIADYAFYLCSNLKTVDFLAATTIGERAFQQCTSLENVDLPAAITIEDYAFYQCSNLVTAIIPQVVTIGIQAFYQCNNLVTAIIPQAVTIEMGAFYQCYDLANIDLPEVVTIGYGAFEGCVSITAIDLPKATTLGDAAFGVCLNLASIDIPEATSIGAYCLGECIVLQSIDLPKVTFIGERAFIYCTALTELKIATASTGLVSTPELLFEEANLVGNITLTIGTAESQIQRVGTDVNGNMWRNYGPFADVIVADAQ